MWCDVGQSCAMMGLQATSGKRKLEGGVGCMDFDMELGESPAKLGRIEGSWWAMDDSYSGQSGSSSASSTSSYYELTDIAPSACHLQSSSSSSSSAGVGSGPCQLSSPASSPSPSHQQTTTHYYQQQQQQQQPQRASSPSYAAAPHRAASTGQWGHHAAAPHHYEPPTIRREENGKSYLELGSSYRANERCCEGSRSSWCRRGRACYRQRRLAVLNISMCKLARYRQFPDPSLHRSVLICNTLRQLEREMERDRSPPPCEPVLGPNAGQQPLAQLQPPEQGRLTPFPVPAGSGAETDQDSGIGDSDDSRSINWGSVLSLSSQSPLDPLNNNELLDVDIGPDLDLDFMPASWKSLASQQQLDEFGQQPQQHPQHPQPSTSTHESLMCVGS